MKIIAMIPARKGSTRLKNKNLAIINKKPLIYYSIKAAKESKVFDSIFLNSDHKLYESLAKRYDINFYLRPKYLGRSFTRSDDVVLDFIKKHKSDILVWVNPISPLQTSLEINKVVKYFIKKNLNSLITTSEKSVHSFYNKKPINFSLKTKFQRTQDLKPIEEMVYSLMIWKTKSFEQNMLKKNHAIIHGKFSTFPVHKFSSYIIKKSEDVLIAESILKKIKSKNLKVKYDKIL
tara:strand:- start:136 stop:837 length:702 start_codon:yes stop_codon:yes gene_type:complete